MRCELNGWTDRQAGGRVAFSRLPIVTTHPSLLEEEAHDVL